MNNHSSFLKIHNNKTINSIALILVLSSCSVVGKKEPTVVVETKIVPIVQECPIPPDDVMEVPHLPVDDINQDTPYSEVARSYVLSVSILRTKINIMKEQLEIYRK